MNWKQFWNNKSLVNNPYIQVGRVINNTAIHEKTIQQTAELIINQLSINASNNVLDVCCGNGLLTNVIANHCNTITGIDFSEGLIKDANINNKNLNAEYILANALNFNLNKQYDKIYLYFSFQYFEGYATGKTAISNCLKHLKPGGKLLIGDIPDKAKWFTFYDSAFKILFFIKQTLLSQNSMGKFWSKAELSKICKELNVNGICIKQQHWQPYYNYRFDYLITKPL